MEIDNSNFAHHSDQRFDHICCQRIKPSYRVSEYTFTLLVKFVRSDSFIPR